MELRHLRYFIAVAEELHFGRAAHRLNMCQPPLSQQIKSLEEELNVRLLDRTRKSVRLTEAGIAFLDDARAIIRRLAEAKNRARSISAGLEGEIGMGIVPSAMDTFLPAAIGAFRIMRPGIAIRMTEMGTLEQLDALRRDRIHLGVARLFDEDLTGIGRQRILEEPYVLAIPSGHDLAARKCAPLAALNGQPFVFFPRETHPQLHDRLMACLASAGASIQIVQEASSKRASVAFVAAGVGLALVPSSAARQGREGVVFRPLIGELPAVEFSLIWRESDESAALGRFIESIVKYGAALDAGGC